jgi:hypothetical protein
MTAFLELARATGMAHHAYWDQHQLASIVVVEVGGYKSTAYRLSRADEIVCASTEALGQTELADFLMRKTTQTIAPSLL